MGYDVKGRFNLHRIPVQDATWKLLKIKKKALGARAIPYIVTHDGRTIPYPDPECHVHDVIKHDFMKGKVLEICHFRVGGICMLTAGRGVGRVGVIQKVERHPGAFDIVIIKDARGQTFSTRKDNIFILGSGRKPLITLPKTQGIKYSIIEDRDMLLKKQANPEHKQNKRKQLMGGIVRPDAVNDLRARQKEKKRLIKILRQQEKKQQKKKPKKKAAKKAAKSDK